MIAAYVHFFQHIYLSATILLTNLPSYQGTYLITYKDDLVKMSKISYLLSFFLCLSFISQTIDLSILQAFNISLSISFSYSIYLYLSFYLPIYLSSYLSSISVYLCSIYPGDLVKVFYMVGDVWKDNQVQINLNKKSQFGARWSDR